MIVYLQALILIMEAIKEAGYEGKIQICMDTAASEFWNDDMKKYDLDFKSPAGDPNDGERYVSLIFIVIHIYHIYIYF